MNGSCKVAGDHRCMTVGVGPAAWGGKTRTAYFEENCIKKRYFIRARPYVCQSSLSPCALRAPTATATSSSISAVAAALVRPLSAGPVCGACAGARGTNKGARPGGKRSDHPSTPTLHRAYTARKVDHTPPTLVTTPPDPATVLELCLPFPCVHPPFILCEEGSLTIPTSGI